jgi:citrate lyase subunit beta/citryl-CoA lyase
MNTSKLNTIARSYLFVPASNLTRVEKALSTNADVVIVDLEDGVAESEKFSARRDLYDFHPSRSVHIRINSVETEHCEEDLRLVTSVGWVDGVVQPMVRSSNDIAEVRAKLPHRTPMLALIETAAGVLCASEIASSGVQRLALGSADYSADLGVAASDELLAYPRSVLAVASAMAGIAPPVDGPSLSINAPDQLAKDAASARALGMGGKFCIHPTQVDLVNATFVPSEVERLWALRVIASIGEQGSGAVVVDGEMVDAPVVARARRILGL